MIAGLFLAPSALRAAPPLTGAIFTTDSTCTDVNVNIYDNKEDVYIDGGPSHPGGGAVDTARATPSLPVTMLFEVSVP